MSTEVPAAALPAMVLAAGGITALLEANLRFSPTLPPKRAPNKLLVLLMFLIGAGAEAEAMLRIMVRLLATSNPGCLWALVLCSNKSTWRFKVVYFF